MCVTGRGTISRRIDVSDGPRILPGMTLDTWMTRDLPVLRAIVDIYEEVGDQIRSVHVPLSDVADSMPTRFSGHCASL